MPLVERCVVGVDVEGFSRVVTRRQVLIQLELDRVLGEAAEAAGLPRTRWERRPAGDGELAVLPADVDLVALVRKFVAELDRLLADHNDDHDPRARIRLRVAMHTGVLTPGALGHAGPALVVLSRLLDSDALRRALRAAPDDHLAHLLSESLYRRAVLPEVGGLRPGQFTRVRVCLPGKGFEEDAYLGVPRARGAERPDPPPAGPPALLREIARNAPARRTAVAEREPERVVGEAPPTPLAPLVRVLVDGVRDALADREVGRADQLTTLALLAQAGRRSCLRGADGSRLTDGLLAELDDAWSGASGGRWGFRAQRARLAGVVLSGRRPFRDICLALGWRTGDDDVIPPYPEFARRAGDGATPFYPTLRNPQGEQDARWHDEWSTTVPAAHKRVREWGR
ncbi:hypothetical protein [Saccharothrix algeriensis]|uniref:Uncharacterized protein n=1 Tax=Saccharothrix algeriensis TaxID=173560 RepID=A0A8T8HX64_9PSEU|nr:hypothetical protein [Saccharothrix algeriensis]MBM7814936.1 hypothetical protein [Saccharothrix algeriensis]QTR03203.1 hypothetical protein J7S33_30335 [Saccharothrix algeriensis]